MPGLGKSGMTRIASAMTWMRLSLVMALGSEVRLSCGPAAAAAGEAGGRRWRGQAQLLAGPAAGDAASRAYRHLGKHV